MIGEVVRGNSMPDLVSYLFGPGKRNEHVNQHLVAGYADATFTADDRLWHDEPGKQRNVHGPARQLGHQLDFPHSRWRPSETDGYVWHCSLSIPKEDGQLTDEQWTEAAHELVRALGFDGADGKAPCRWIAVRHGLSANGNDHIHVAVNLVREDGTKASTWNDYRKVGRVCSDLEDRFGLTKVNGRMTGRSLPEPSRADAELSAKHGDPEPLRVRLERKVRACAAIATSEDQFTQIARQCGLLIRPRRSPDGATVTGYAFADPAGRKAKDGSPVWFGGGKLAPDLTVTKLRARWASPPNPLTQAADTLAVVAVTTGTDASGRLAKAERHMARAAQEPALATSVIATMTDTFTAIITADPLRLARELEGLITDCLVAATTKTGRDEVTRAGDLIWASATALAQQAELQAQYALHGENAMTELTHEEELLDHLAKAGIFTAHVIRALRGLGGTTADADALRAAGYTETTPYDACLRELLGEERWAKYEADPGRIKAAAAITDAARAGYDVPRLLKRAVNRRRWEDDPRSPSQSVADVLTWRIARTLADPRERRTLLSRPQPEFSSDLRTTDGASAGMSSPAVPEPVTPFDATLRNLLGEDRWRQYAEDPSRAQVARLITKAADDGRDIPELLENAVTCRELEDDPVNPARSIAAVLHYRLKKAVADKGKTRTGTQDAPLRTPARARTHDARETR
jgi:hypothetical protein